jgi:hypothetical protein
MRRVVWHTQNDRIPTCCDLRNDQKKSDLKLSAPLVGFLVENLTSWKDFDLFLNSLHSFLQA